MSPDTEPNTPANTSTNTSANTSASKKPKLWMTIIQIIGFAGGLAALVWAVRVATSPQNREQLAKLSDATAGELILLMSLAATSVAVNGFIFWVVLNPVHKIRLTDVISINAIATLLAYLPFKLSVVSRFVIHNRRDKVPVVTIGAWILAEGILMAAVFGPIALVSLWQQEINTIWVITSLIGIYVCTIVGSWIARQLAGDIGIERLSKLGIKDAIIARPSFMRLHSGFDMLGNARSTFLTNTFRIIDILAFALRFYIAARVLELPISAPDSLLLGATYFMIGAASPFGMLGTREAGTIAMASMVGISSAALSEDATGTVPIAATVLFVTAIEALVNLTCAGFGLAWLRARPGLGYHPDEHPPIQTKDKAQDTTPP